MENEEWRANSNEEHDDASRDGNRYYNREGGYNRPSYNQGERPQRPRFNPNSEGGYRSYNQDRPQRPSYNQGDRPQRPRFNPNNNEGGGYRSYNQDRPQRPSYNQGDRPSYNQGDRPSYGNRPSYNQDRPSYNQDRPQRPRFNPGNNEDGGYRSYNQDRPQRPSYNQGDRPQRPSYNQGDRPSYNQGDRPQRPYGNQQRSSYGNQQRPYGNQQRPYGNQGGGYRQQQRPGMGRPMHRTPDYDPNAKYSQKKRIEYKELHVDPNEPIRLNKFMANAGICSRREADEFIAAGVVTVNGEVVTELGTKIKHGDEVKFHDQAVSIERKVYVLLNKPKDCVTTSDDPQARLTVMDLVKQACTERIYPVGRLDRNTTGVLLLTNDGDLASKLTHPKFLKKKIYHVYTDKNVTKADMDKIAAGIELEDGEIRADAINYSDEIKRDQVGIEIHSGKNRVVRRIFESLGYKVVKLDRVFFAGLTKKGLRRGEWRYLTEQEVNFLRMGSFE